MIDALFTPFSVNGPVSNALFSLLPLSPFDALFILFFVDGCVISTLFTLLTLSPSDNCCFNYFNTKADMLPNCRLCLFDTMELLLIAFGIALHTHLIPPTVPITMQIL